MYERFKIDGQVVYSNGSDRETDFEQFERFQNKNKREIVLPAMAFSRDSIEAAPRKNYKHRDQLITTRNSDTTDIVSFSEAEINYTARIYTNRGQEDDLLQGYWLVLASNPAVIKYKTEIDGIKGEELLLQLECQPISQALKADSQRSETGPIYGFEAPFKIRAVLYVPCKNEPLIRSYKMKLKDISLEDNDKDIVHREWTVDLPDAEE